MSNQPAKSTKRPADLSKHTGLPGNADRSERKKTAVTDETYIELQAADRVVMRRNIALDLDSFKAASDDFLVRPTREYPALESEIPPFFSVIIPNYNGQQHLPDVLNALSQQTFQDFETIVSDDASTDDSVTFVETHYPWVRVLANRQNLGFAANCNTASAAAHGRVLVMLNNDTEPEADFLSELARAICAQPDAAIVAAKLLLWDERDKLHTAGDQMGFDGIPRNRGVWQEDTGQFDSLTGVFGGCGGGLAFRKDVWTELGGFDEDFWMYLEDVDYAFRARLKGYDVVFAPAARAYHKLSATGGGTMDSYYVGRNTIWNIVKNMPTSLLIRNLPAILLAQMEITLDALQNLQGEAAQARLKGQLAGLVGIPHMLAKRQLIQTRRKIADEEIAGLLVQ